MCIPGQVVDDGDSAFMTKHVLTDSRKSRKTYFIYMKWAENSVILGIYVRIFMLTRPLLFSFTQQTLRESVKNREIILSLIVL